MTDEINTILNELDALGATESTAPIRAYISAVESNLQLAQQQLAETSAARDAITAQASDLASQLSVANSRLATAVNARGFVPPLLDALNAFMNATANVNG